MKFCNACGRGNPPESSACERCQAPFGQGGDAEGGMGPGAKLRDGSYEIVRHIGQGGMGTVYLATDLRLEREVALKLLNRELMGHATARTRMEREANALARLNHPNVVDIYDVFEHEGTLALVIEYVQGGALTDRLGQGVMPWREAVRFIDGILSGLEGLHEAGLVHRDLKPDNVLIDPRGDTPKITDLGVAHDAAGRGMTRQGTRLGTPEYMSPEQVQGVEIDGRSDLYAAGIVLYEMLTGQVPFTGESEWGIWDAQVRQAPDLSRIPSEVPEAITTALKTALAKDPQERFESAKAMRQALELPQDAPDSDIQALIDASVKEAVSDALEQALAGPIARAIEDAGARAIQHATQGAAPRETTGGSQSSLAHGTEERSADWGSLIVGGSAAQHDEADHSSVDPEILFEALTGRTWADLGNKHWLDLKNTAADDETLVHLDRLMHVTWLNLNNSAVTDHGLTHLTHLKNLSWLSLAKTNVTASGLEALKNLKSLNHLDLTGTNITISDISKLKRALPRLKIMLNGMTYK
jgi:hypothetical protein